MGEPTLRWRIERAEGEMRVALAGEITEDGDFGKLLGELGDQIVFDLGEVRRINSTGVREWIQFVGKLTLARKSFALERCSVPIVHQLNTISNFRGAGQLRSVYAPYFCPTCSLDATRLLSIGANLREQIDVPLACPKCKSPMEFDDLVESYLVLGTGA